MKRNLLALFLAVVMMTSLVLMAAPVAKAAENDPLEFYEGEEVVITKDTYLDLNGKNLTVTVQDGATLYVIDSAADLLTGEGTGKLTVKGGANNIPLSTTNASNNMRYLKIDNGDGTYSFHPFYLTVDKYGVNFKKDAVCVRGIFLASNKVKELITSERGDYGFVVDEDETKTASAKAYAFTKNGVEAYGDLVGSFDSEKVETSHKIGAYICVDGEYVFSAQAPKINPSVVLKTVNAQFAGVSSTNKDRIKYLAERHPHLATYLNNLETENVLSESTITFDDTAKRSSFSTTEQVWEENGITVTNTKTSTSSNIVENFAPVRFYSGSKLTITYPNMKAITIIANDKLTGLDGASISDGSINREGNIITITFDAPTNSFSTTLTNQLRADSMTITAGSGEQCDHNSATEATCETPKFCDDCGAIMENAKSHTGGIPSCTATGICTECGVAYLPMVEHNDDNDDGTCDTCTWNIRKVTVKSTVPVATKTVSVNIGEYASANGWTSGMQYSSLTMGNGDITVTTNGGGNTGKYYSSGNNWRIYQTESPKITVSAVGGANITSIKITYSVSNTGVLTYNNNNIPSGTVVKINSDSATFGVGNTGSATNGQVQITAIEVVYEACEHKYTSEITTAATCTTKGVETFTCSVCGHSYTEEIKALEHKFDNGKCQNPGCNVTENTAKWQKATSIAIGDVVTLVCEDKKMELSGISTTSTKYGTGVAYTTVAGKYTLTVVAGSTSGTYAFKTANGQYLYWTSGNSLATSSTLNANTSWKVSFDSNGNVVIQNAKDNSRQLQWNASSPRFACYTSNQTAIQLYVYE